MLSVKDSTESLLAYWGNAWFLTIMRQSSDPFQAGGAECPWDKVLKLRVQSSLHCQSSLLARVCNNASATLLLDLNLAFLPMLSSSNHWFKAGHLGPRWWTSIPISLTSSDWLVQTYFHTSDSCTWRTHPCLTFSLCTFDPLYPKVCFLWCRTPLFPKG